MIYYDNEKQKWVDEEPPSAWIECVAGAVLFALVVVALFGYWAWSL